MGKLSVVKSKDLLYFPNTHEYGSVAPGHVDVMRDSRLRKQLGLVTAIAGGDRGYNTEGDVITETVDGVPLNNIWAEFQATLNVQNARRDTLVSFLTYTVDQPTVTVPQFGGGEDFEIASEFGVPKSMRPTSSYFQMGFDFEWYDTATRFTWKYLAEATAAQVESVHQSVLEADNRLVFNEVMRTLFSNVNRDVDIRNRPYTVYAFYNADGTVPPEYKSNTFDGTHNHYLTSGAAVIDSGDVDTVMTNLQHHGYSKANGAELVLLVNQQEGDVIRTFRSPPNGGTAKYDFIPATNQATFMIPQIFLTGTQIVGSRPGGTFRGLDVIGSYGDFLIVVEDYIPAGYVVGFATGGDQSLTNPIGIREHARQELRGLRIVKGRSPDYPLQDSYYQRGFGTGIRQRGAGVVMQITANASYAPPAQFA
jgi:hypothetical protein